jgi:hypothetical protein
VGVLKPHELLQLESSILSEIMCYIETTEANEIYVDISSLSTTYPIQNNRQYQYCATKKGWHSLFKPIQLAKVATKNEAIYLEMVLLEYLFDEIPEKLKNINNGGGGGLSNVGPYFVMISFKN